MYSRIALGSSPPVVRSTALVAKYLDWSARCTLGMPSLALSEARKQHLFMGAMAQASWSAKLSVSEQLQNAAATIAHLFQTMR